MRPQSVEIKVTIAQDVDSAVAALSLSGAERWKIGFCEDQTDAVTRGTPLQKLGVILRVRRRSGTKGDTTVKLRPCRWSQLEAGFFANAEALGAELKIEADWAGGNRGLSTSLSVKWEDDRFDRVLDGSLAAPGLFDPRQQEFLDRCAPARVNLAAVTLLPVFDAARYDSFDVLVGGQELSIRAERWTIPGGDPDFLELSVVGDPDTAVAKQAALEKFAADRALVVDGSGQNKTQLVLDKLISL